MRSKAIYVYNIPMGLSEEQVLLLFQGYRKCLEVRVMADMETNGRSLVAYAAFNTVAASCACKRDLETKPPSYAPEILLDFYQGTPPSGPGMQVLLSEDPTSAASGPPPAAAAHSHPQMHTTRTHPTADSQPHPTGQPMSSNVRPSIMPGRNRMGIQPAQHQEMDPSTGTSRLNPEDEEEKMLLEVQAKYMQWQRQSQASGQAPPGSRNPATSQPNSSRSNRSHEVPGLSSNRMSSYNDSKGPQSSRRGSSSKPTVYKFV